MALPLKRVKSIKWFAKIRDAFGSVNYEQFFYNEITPLRSGSFTKAFNGNCKEKI